MIWNIVHFQVGISFKVISTNSTLKWFVSFMNWSFVHFQVRISFKASTTNSTLKWIVTFMNWSFVHFQVGILCKLWNTKLALKWLLSFLKTDLMCLLFCKAFFSLSDISVKIGTWPGFPYFGQFDKYSWSETILTLFVRPFMKGPGLINADFKQHCTKCKHYFCRDEHSVGRGQT